MRPSFRKVLAGAIVMAETLPLLPPPAAVSPARERSLGHGFSSMAAHKRLHPRRPASGACIAIPFGLI